MGVLDERFEGLDAFISCDKFALGNGDPLLQAFILLNKLSLDMRKLLKISLQEGHLLLLGYPPVQDLTQKVQAKLANLYDNRDAACGLKT
jgi:hypothetical protein